MKFYPVTPGGILSCLPGGWKHHLLLSNHVVADRRYVEHFQWARSTGGEFSIILDNPIHERLPVPQLTDRLWAARRLKVTTVVAPDVIGDPDESMSLLRIHLRGRLNRYFNTLAVVQGRTSEEYFAHAERLALMVNYIGIPQIRSGAEFNRAEFVKLLSDKGFFDRYPSIKIHLLGNIDLFEDAIALRNVPQVIGIDSAKPVYLGMAGVDIRNGEEARVMRRPPNFFDVNRTELTDTQRHLIRRNVETVQGWVSDGD